MKRKLYIYLGLISLVASASLVLIIFKDWPYLPFVRLPAEAKIVSGFVDASDLGKLVAEKRYDLIRTDPLLFRPDDMYVILLRYEGPSYLSCSLKIKWEDKPIRDARVKLSVFRNSCDFVIFRSKSLQKQGNGLHPPAVELVAVYKK